MQLSDMLLTSRWSNI